MVNESHETIRDAVMDVVGTHFRPEFINRIDDAVVFHALGRDHIRGILDVQLFNLRSRLEELDYRLELTDKVTEKLCKAGYDPVYGARPLKRAIQTHLNPRRIASERRFAAERPSEDSLHLVDKPAK